MKIKILNSYKGNCFIQSDINCEKEVYAMFKQKGEYYYLINNGLPLFIKKDETITVIDNKIPKDWVYTKKYVDNYTNPVENVICLRDLYCPQWMLDEKSFMFECFLNREIAQFKFFKNHKK